MQLKKAELSGTTSASGLGLQHEAAMRIEARWRAEEKRRRHLLLMERLKTCLAVLLVAAALGGGGWYAWRNGKLDGVLAHVGVAPVEAPAAPVAAKAPAVASGDVDAAVRKVESGIDAFNAVVARFSGAAIAYWKDADPADKPKKNGPAVDYTALVPDAKGGFEVLNVLLSGDNSMKVKRITRTRGPVDVPRAEFDKMVEATPYLVMREGRAYYCAPGKPVRQPGISVPKLGDGVNPSRLEFGALYDLVRKVKLARPAFRYDVFLDHAQFRKRLPVATVGFGEEVPRERFEAAARAAVDDDAAVAVILDVGKVVFSPAK